MNRHCVKSGTKQEGETRIRFGKGDVHKSTNRSHISERFGTKRKRQVREGPTQRDPGSRRERGEKGWTYGWELKLGYSPVAG